MIVADKLDELCRLLSQHVPIGDARKRAGVTDKQYEKLLEDPKARTRIEAATRGVVAPERSDDDASIASSGFPWEQFVHDPIGRLRAIDRVLAANNFHPMSFYWDEQFDAFYASKKFQFTSRAGRRGGKSSDSCRAMVSEGVGVERHLPPGEAGVWPIISWSMYEANKRLDTIEEILKALAFRLVDKKPEEFGTYQRTTELGRKLIRTLDIRRNIIEWATYPASIGGVSGFTAIGALCDEAAKWKDEKTGANPASVVLASLRPCFATQPDAHLYLISSAYSTIDAHHDAVEKGDTDLQYLARLGERGAAVDIEQRTRAVDMFERRAEVYAQEGRTVESLVAKQRARTLRESIPSINALSPNVPTWASNPTLDIERTLLLEDDFPTWLREYASVPTGGGGAYFFDHQTIDACSVAIHVVRKPRKVGVGIDPGLESNSFAACVWGLDDTGAWLLDALELLPTPGNPLDDEESFTECAELATKHNAKAWATDGHYIATARRVGGRYKIATIRAPNDNGAVFIDFRRELGKGKISIAGHGLSVRIARQIKGVMSSPLAKEQTKIIMPKDGAVHGDLASAAVRGWWALTHQAAKPLWLDRLSQANRGVR